MKKPKSKARIKDAYTPTQVGTLIDRFRGEFGAFGEKLESMSGKLDATYEQVAKNTEDVELLKTAVREIADKVNKLTQKVDELTNAINDLVKTKLDREEFHALESRVSALETKLATLSR